MIVESDKLGVLDINDEHVITFAEGIPGFEEETQFALVEHGEESPFLFLQSIANQALTFIGVDPFSFFGDYQIELDDDFLEDMELSSENHPYILCLVSVPDVYEKMTANLMAPVVMNMKKRIAKQVILEKTVYTTRHFLFTDPQRREGGK